MWKLIKQLLGRSQASPKAIPSPLNGGFSREQFTVRLGKVVRKEQAFEACTSGNLDDMLRALKTKTNLIDRHFLLMGIVDQTYKARNDPRMRITCKAIAKQHINEFARIAPALRKDMGGILPRVTTFQKYATLLAEDNEFELAIQVCNTAIKFGLKDNTKTGYAGRIARYKKKMEGAE